MADKAYHEGHWFFDYSHGGWFYMPEGYYEMNAEPDRSDWIFLRPEKAEKLIRTMDEQGFIKPRLDERLRSQDLKITHRLLDLLDNMCARPH
jgi:hypothetical protein